MPVPDPARSRAVLIGIDTYTHPDLKPLPAAAAGARHLATLLRDPTVWGLPPEHVTELGAEASAEQILVAVYGVARHATDTLLVYFAGHGLRDRAERLYLALAGANADQPEIGTVHYRTLRNVLRQSGHQARYRITMLDCCYSGLAGAMSFTAAPTRTELARALDERLAEQTDDADYGDCVLTSAPPTKPSFAPPEAEFPEFTGELIDILEHGITGAGPTLSLDDVWQRIWRRLRERGSPEPQQFAQNKVARQVRLRNRASALGGPSLNESALRLSADRDIALIEQQAVFVPPEETTTADSEPDPASRPDYAAAPSQAPLPPSAKPPHPASPTAPTPPEAHQAPTQTGEQPAPDTSESGPAKHHTNPTPPLHGHTTRPQRPISRRHALLALTGTTLTAATLATWKILDNSSSGSHTGAKSSPSATLSPTRTPGKQLWVFPTKGNVDSSPVVADGVVYVGSEDTNLYAVDARTGKKRWALPISISTSSQQAVADGIVYVGSDDNNLYAVDARTGKKRWTFAADAEVYRSPTVVDGVVYFGSYDNYLYAVDATTGKKRWTFPTGAAVASTPAVADGVVYIGSEDASLYAVDATTGKKRWTFPFPTTYPVSSEQTVADGVVYVGSHDNKLYAVDAKTGEKRWTFPAGTGGSSAPAVADGVVYVGSADASLSAVNAKTGEKRWTFPAGTGESSAPAVADGVVYVGSADNDNLYAVDAKTGKKRWTFLTGAAVASTPAVADGVVYFGSQDNNLYAVQT